jgi:hypothetical protein
MELANKGWIKLHRSIIDNVHYFSEPFTRMQAWIDLLLIANHKEGYLFIRGNKVVVGRGQIGTSSRSLAKRWMWSRGKVERFLNDLENEGQIEPLKTNLITLLSICNYDLYQYIEPQIEPQTEPQTGHRQDHKQNHRQGHNKKNKNEKNDKNEKNIPPPTPQGDDDVYPFDDFWDDYGKKVGDKGKLVKKWMKLSDKDKLSIKAYIPMYQKAQPDKQYRKNPETFLNNRSWNDEIISRKDGKQQPSDSNPRTGAISEDYKRSLFERLQRGGSAEEMQGH